jgi:hypothetical protein
MKMVPPGDCTGPAAPPWQATRVSIISSPFCHQIGTQTSIDWQLSGTNALVDSLFLCTAEKKPLFGRRQGYWTVAPILLISMRVGFLKSPVILVVACPF